MLVYCGLFILNLFVITAAHHSIIISKPEIKNRKVNLALETVLEFNNKDNTADLKFLNNVQDFIGKVKRVIDKKHVQRRDINEGKLEKFTDFLHNAIEILVKYDDEDLEDFFSILNEEIRKYHYRGCKFHELTDNYDLRKYIAGQLNAFINRPAKDIRHKMLDIAQRLEDEEYSDNEKELVDFINSLYRQDAIDKFQNILVNLDNYRLKAKDMNLVKIIRQGTRSIIFDHYTGLNYNARTALKSKIDEYWSYLMDLSKTLVLQLNAEEDKLRNYNKDIIGNYTIKDKLRKASINDDIEATKTTTTGIYINLNTDVKDEYETKSYTQKSEIEKRVKKLTHKTLYPKFVTDNELKFRVSHAPTIDSKILKLEKEIDKDSIKDRKSRQHNSKTKKSLKQRAKFSNIKRQKEKRTKNLDVKQDPLVNNKITTKRKSRLTFLTLYPEFIEDVTTRKPKVIKKQFSPKSIENTMQTLWNEEITESYVFDGKPNVESTERKGFIEVVTIKPHALRTMKSIEKIKYEINLKTQNARKYLALVTKTPPREFLDVATNFDRQINSLPTKSAKKFNKKNSLVNNERNLKLIDKSNHRRYIGETGTQIPEDGIVVDRRILVRLQDLEKELKDVKKQIQNDTETIKDLNSKVHRNTNDHDEFKHAKKYYNIKVNENSKNQPMKEVVIDLAAQIDLNHDKINKKNSNTVKWKSYPRKYETELNKKGIERNYDSDKNSYNRDIVGQLESKIERNSGTSKKHTYELKTFTEKPYRVRYSKDKENKYDRSTINRLDDEEENEQYNRNFELLDKSNKEASHTYKLRNYAGDKYKHYLNTADIRKYDLDTDTFNTDKYNNHEKIKNKRYREMNDLKKEQERKYYAQPKKQAPYVSEENMYTKPRVRVYDSDSNRKPKKLKIDKINTFSNDMEIKRLIKYEKPESYISQAHLPKSDNFNKNRQQSTIKRIYDSDGDKPTKPRIGSRFKTILNRDIYMKADESNRNDPNTDRTYDYPRESTKQEEQHLNSRTDIDDHTTSSTKRDNNNEEDKNKQERKDAYQKHSFNSEIYKNENLTQHYYDTKARDAVNDDNYSKITTDYVQDLYAQINKLNSGRQRIHDLKESAAEQDFLNSYMLKDYNNKQHSHLDRNHESKEKHAVMHDKYTGGTELKQDIIKSTPFNDERKITNISKVHNIEEQKYNDNESKLNYDTETRFIFKADSNKYMLTKYKQQKDFHTNKDMKAEDIPTVHKITSTIGIDTETTYEVQTMTDQESSSVNNKAQQEDITENQSSTYRSNTLENTETHANKDVTTTTEETITITTTSYTEDTTQNTEDHLKTESTNIKTSMEKDNKEAETAFDNDTNTSTDMAPETVQTTTPLAVRRTIIDFIRPPTSIPTETSIPVEVTEYLNRRRNSELDTQTEFHDPFNNLDSLETIKAEPPDYDDIGKLADRPALEVLRKFEEDKFNASLINPEPDVDILRRTEIFDKNNVSDQLEKDTYDILKMYNDININETLDRVPAPNHLPPADFMLNDDFGL